MEQHSVQFVVMYGNPAGGLVTFRTSAATFILTLLYSASLG